MSWIRQPRTWIPGLIFFGYILMGLGAAMGWIGAEFDVVNNDLSYQRPSSDFWLGTDLFGRSVAERSFHATKIALVIGTTSTLLALMIGVFLGALSGYLGGWVDQVVVWLYTTLDSIPYILLLAAFAFSLGQGLWNVFIALGLTSWTTLCKMVRSEFKIGRAHV